MNQVDWTQKFVKAYHAVVPDMTAFVTMEEKLMSEIKVNFTWLKEVVMEACYVFSYKSTKLRPLPETPIERNQGKMKKISHIKKMYLEEQEEEISALPQAVGISSTDNILEAEDRNSKQTKSLECCTKNKLSTIPSPAVEEIKDSNSSNSSNSPDHNKISNNVFSNAVVKTKISITSKESKLDSPSVKERTFAYESMIKENGLTCAGLKVVKTASTARDWTSVPLQLNPKLRETEGSAVKSSPEPCKKKSGRQLPKPDPSQRTSNLPKSQRPSLRQRHKQPSVKTTRKSGRPPKQTNIVVALCDKVNQADKANTTVTKSKRAEVIKMDQSGGSQQSRGILPRSGSQQKISGSQQGENSLGKNSDRSSCSQTVKVHHDPRSLTHKRRPKAEKGLNLPNCCSDEEVISCSPTVSKIFTHLKSKRLADDRGTSPHPKRRKSCLLKEDCRDLIQPLSAIEPLSASSPINTSDPNNRVKIDQKFLSPIRSPKAFKFHSSQKNPAGFLTRTPGFGMATDKLCTFANSGLIKNNILPKRNLQEEKKQRLLEKEMRDEEKVKRAAEMRRQRIEERKRLRAQKEFKVAEARKMQQLVEEKQNVKLNKKLEELNMIPEKLMVARLKEENGKTNLRMRKQQSVIAKRQLDAEERLKKILEQQKEQVDADHRRLATEEEKSSYKTKTGKSEPTTNKMKIPAKGGHSEIESYDIADKNSDDSTDNEDAPKKTIPKWCLGENIVKAIMIQETSQVDPDIIFQANRIVPPDLRLIFSRKKKFKERTSSALWTSPVMKVTSIVN